MAASAGLADPLPAWRSATTPSCGVHMVAPGAVALEAAAITVPVLVAVGERDVVPDPWMEPKAFKSAHDVSVFVCPRMGHIDRQSVVSGKSVSVRVDLGGRRIIKKKKNKQRTTKTTMTKIE